MAVGSRRAGRQRLCSREPLISASRYSDQCSRLLSSAAVLGAAASRAWLEPAPTGTWPTSPSSPRSRGSSTWRRSTPCALALALRTALARTPATTPVPRNDPARVRRLLPRQIPSSASPAPPQVLRGAPPSRHILRSVSSSTALKGGRVATGSSAQVARTIGRQGERAAAALPTARWPGRP